MNLGDVAGELYALRPEEFTAARNQRAKDVRGGDKQLADAIKVLPRPSTAAWVVNMLVRHQADDLEQVLTLGASLRQAQEEMDGAELRELNKQRRQLTAAVTSQARVVARDLGVRVTEAVASQVEETLRAAMIDEVAADAVRTGQLVEPLSATGLGDLDVSTAVAVPESLGMTARPVTRQRPKLTVVEDDPDEVRERALAQAQETSRQADEAAAKARKKLGKAVKRLSRLEARNLQLQAELDEVRRRAGELEHEIETVDDELCEAEARRDLAAEKQDVARVAAEDARADLSRLT